MYTWPNGRRADTGYGLPMASGGSDANAMANYTVSQKNKTPNSWP